MADRFSDTLGKQLFVWSGWVFTVGGTIGSFVLGQANAWIGWLAVLDGYSCPDRPLLCISPAEPRVGGPVREAGRPTPGKPRTETQRSPTRPCEPNPRTGRTSIAYGCRCQTGHARRLCTSHGAVRGGCRRSSPAIVRSSDKAIYAVAKIAEAVSPTLREERFIHPGPDRRGVANELCGHGRPPNTRPDSRHRLLPAIGVVIWRGTGDRTVGYCGRSQRTNGLHHSPGVRCRMV